MTSASPLGWTIWGLIAIWCAILWITKFTHANWGIRFLAGRCALLFTLALILSSQPGFPKLHLVWIAPLLYAATMAISGKIIEAQIEMAPKRAEAESKRTGEALDAILEREARRWGYELAEADPAAGVEEPGNR